MNQKKRFALQKKKSQSETELGDILITLECQKVECQTIAIAKRKKPHSQVQLLEYSEQNENQEDQQCQAECQLKNTVVNYQQVPSLLSIYTSESNISLEEEYEIWDDNKDLRVIKIIIEDQKPSIGQFLQLYKARFGGFPGQQQCIKNEEVIKTAVNYASSSKQLFKKYFPSKKIVFEDDNDYSEPYKIEDDHHYQTFNHFFQFKKSRTFIEI
ncbi:unnamed protein product [Paramecium sonneborni]|uniref:Uncharacterized protein n=1 Tax=Paramecium sonneborni TaxID=65129 RepID=A0A8S1R6J2_9CILI|nr:unnamed protein product [Paramecium sonneborni]